MRVCRSTIPSITHHQSPNPTPPNPTPTYPIDPKPPIHPPAIAPPAAAGTRCALLVLTLAWLWTGTVRARAAVVGNAVVGYGCGWCCGVAVDGWVDGYGSVRRVLIDRSRQSERAQRVHAMSGVVVVGGVCGFGLGGGPKIFGSALSLPLQPSCSHTSSDQGEQPSRRPICIC